MARPSCSSSSRLGGYKIVFMKAKAPVQTLAAYDEMIVKDVKLPTVTNQPTSDVVRTIPD